MTQGERGSIGGIIVSFECVRQRRSEAQVPNTGGSRRGKGRQAISAVHSLSASWGPDAVGGSLVITGNQAELLTQKYVFGT